MGFVRVTPEAVFDPASGRPDPLPFCHLGRREYR